MSLIELRNKFITRIHVNTFFECSNLRLLDLENLKHFDGIYQNGNVEFVRIPQCKDIFDFANREKVSEDSHPS
jgi:hypothetical protein